MIKVLLLIFEPQVTWDKIEQAQRGVLFILGFFLLPLLLLTAGIEGYGLANWGRWQGEVARLKKISVGEAVVVESAQVLLALLVVFAGARLLKEVGETFRGEPSYTQAFRTVAYGLGPLFLLRLVDLFPFPSPWTSWGIG
ncbi:MAG TPA: YIP1 family protein, partial [Verrucomicrobiota bacterium]|nr:YIP1 family protein [Verrucomicrobiota bacterium]